MKPVAEGELINWLLARIPALQPRYEVARAEWGTNEETGEEYINAYFLFSLVVKPYIHDLLTASDTENLQNVFKLLEYLANDGDPSVQNELKVVMEELERWRVWRFLGPTIQHNEFEALTWFPDRVDRTTRINTHVDQAQYQDRWREEIAKIGGFENLTAPHELLIRYHLVHEFRIVGLRAPEPGGAEWRAYGLPWPLPSEQS